MARVAVSAASRKKSLLVVMRGNREFSGVIGIILASVLKFIQDSPTNFRFPPGNVSAISPGQDENYELIISHPSMVDSGRIVGNPEVTSYEHPIGNGKFAHSEVSTT
jgi:hypothetical protein